MTAADSRYVEHRDGEVWWGVWDRRYQVFVDDRRWLSSWPCEVAASRLNHSIPEAGDMSITDGLGR